VIRFIDYPQPLEWDSRLYEENEEDGTINPKYMGQWCHMKIQNPRRHHQWVPNDKFVSDHLALMCVFVFRDENLAVKWN